MGAGHDDSALGAVDVFLPCPTILRGDGAFEVNPLATAIRAGTGLELRDLVALTAGTA